MASACPVFCHHSPAVSPGEGTIGPSRMSNDASTSSATSGPANPPRDCATTMTSPFRGVALATAIA